MKEVVLVLLSVFMLVSTQEYLPKEPGYLPINDLYARDIARSGWDTFWKVFKVNGPSSFHRFL